jgi:hypothetical protein
MQLIQLGFVSQPLCSYLVKKLSLNYIAPCIVLDIYQSFRGV